MTHRYYDNLNRTRHSHAPSHHYQPSIRLDGVRDDNPADYDPANDRRAR